MAKLGYTSLHDGKILIRTGDGTRKSWRKLINPDDEVMTLNYKKHLFTVDTENKTINSVEDLPNDIFAPIRKTPIDKLYVVKPRWTAEQEAIIASGAALILDGVDYLAKDGKKICKCCNDQKDVSEFYNKANQKDKLFPRCKECDTRRKKVAKEAKQAQEA